MTSTIFRRILSPRCNLLPLLCCRKSIHNELDSYMYEEKVPHTPVLLDEVIENLNLKEGNFLLDMTFGAGGHTKALLESVPNLQVFALDRDPIANEYARKLQDKYPGQVIPLEGKFSDLTTLFTDFLVPPNTFDGILFDLGCSTMQCNTAERGFSNIQNGPLDMRMDGGKSDTLTAADVIAYAEEKQLVQIFKIYGGEKKAPKIARAIVQARAAFQPLKTTKDLNDLVEVVLDRDQRTDKLERSTKVARKIFRALRVFVNNEFNELNYGLMLAHIFLKVGGRVAVITSDPFEDKVVKRHFQNLSIDDLKKPLPLIYLNPNKNYSGSEIKDFQIKKWLLVNKKVIVSGDEYMMSASTSSPKLRIAVKLEKTKDLDDMLS